MKTHIEHKFLSVRQYVYTPIHMTLGDRLLRMREVCCWGDVCRWKTCTRLYNNFQLTLLEKETGWKFWRIKLSQELTQATYMTVGWN